MREDTMIKKILASGKYDILPKISKPLQVVQGAMPKTFLSEGGGGLNCQILSLSISHIMMIIW